MGLGPGQQPEAVGAGHLAPQTWPRPLPPPFSELRKWGGGGLWGVLSIEEEADSLATPPSASLFPWRGRISGAATSGAPQVPPDLGQGL